MVDRTQDVIDLYSEPYYRDEAVHYILKTQKGNYTKGHQMCFGGLRGMPVINKDDYIVNGIQSETDHYKEVSEEDHKFYLAWLMTESPFKEGFLEHDVDWSMENKTTIHHVDQPGNLMLGALSAVRAMTEGVSCYGYKYFKKLVDAGCTKETAFILMYYLFPCAKKGLIEVSKFSYNGGHTAWGESSTGDNSVVNFINGKLPGLLPYHFCDSRYFDGVQVLFGSKGRGDKSLNDWILESNDKSITTGITYNSWGDRVDTKVKNLILPEQEMIEYLASLSDRIYKEWVK